MHVSPHRFFPPSPGDAVYQDACTHAHAPSNPARNTTCSRRVDDGVHTTLRAPAGAAGGADPAGGHHLPERARDHGAPRASCLADPSRPQARPPMRAIAGAAQVCARVFMCACGRAGARVCACLGKSSKAPCAYGTPWRVLCLVYYNSRWVKVWRCAAAACLTSHPASPIVQAITGMPVDSIEDAKLAANRLLEMGGASCAWHDSSHRVTAHGEITANDCSLSLARRPQHTAGTARCKTRWGGAAAGAAATAAAQFSRPTRARS